MKAVINITPLVDVVLVLLIIFMVMAPQMMRKGPDLDLPNTAKPREQGDERGRILVSLDKAGGLWIDDQPVPASDPDPKVVLRGDAGLRFGDVRLAMLAIERAGFQGVGLIAKSAGSAAKGD
jgi:biopolymer transport protein ExbD